ncbi:MAG: DUF4876 domain-containing protein [Dysgonamonadaceae bacterium]|jgi:hypothetical protein|nr:DUF4876 domain-containing protein [Dysgonamonadaceae bacterium]
MENNKKQLVNRTPGGFSRGLFFKKGLYALVAAALLLVTFSCEKEPVVPAVYSVKVQLVYPEGFEPVAGVEVSLGTYTAPADASGIAVFEVNAGIYEASASEQREDEYYKYSLNANQSGIVVNESWTGAEQVNLEYALSATPQLDEGSAAPKGRVIIKELYSGGCQKDDGSGTFNYGTYLILYNNSNGVADLTHLALATTLPANGHATNSFFKNGVLEYAAEGWLPAGYGLVYFPDKVELEPGQQLVIALSSAIDNTQTYSQAVNLARAEYYAVYDPESGFNHALTYPAPAQEIPASHYLKGIRLPGASSTSFTVSLNSPALFLFTPPAGSSIVDVATDASRLTTHGAGATQVVLKVPVEWVVDGIEVFFNSNLPTSNKRLTPDVDGGWVGHTNAQGYTLYRNVDKAATEAITGNAGKLVYNYALGTDDLENGSTDPSGIDAEASIQNGARIIYKETNNSANDFHQRKKASLRN